ncbi:DUF2533 family protein [Niallia sp. 01092]|uniref:DUF2533 family protein n=1 Tax=unclassified Niallia TaxID=2837522 RepID=UPI003FD3BB00
MSVHKAITKHVEQVNSRVNVFKQLDDLREQYIEEALQLCSKGESFSVQKINEVTEEINTMAKLGVTPTRKVVTIEMVKEYAEKLK